jgi:Matrixin
MTDRNFERVAAHEFGHSMGMEHSGGRGDLMSQPVGNSKLMNDDFFNNLVHQGKTGSRILTSTNPSLELRRSSTTTIKIEAATVRWKK